MADMQMTALMAVVCFLIIGGGIAAAAFLIRAIFPDDKEKNGG